MGSVWKFVIMTAFTRIIVMCCHGGQTGEELYCIKLRGARATTHALCYATTKTQQSGS